MRINQYISELEEKEVMYVLTIGDKVAERLCFSLREEYFTDKHRKMVFKACSELFENGKPVSMATVVSHLKGTYTLSQTDIHLIMQNDLSGAERYTYTPNIRKYVDTLHRAYVNREAQKAVQFYYEQIEVADPYAASLTLISTIDDLAKTVEKDDFQTISAKAIEQAEKIRQIAAGEYAETHTKTFIPTLDKIIGGFYPKQFITLAARPGQGKSLLALQIALNQSTRQFPVAYITLEMSTEEQVLRCFASKTEIPTKTLKNAKYLSAEQMIRVQEQSLKFDRIPLYFNDDATIDTIQIESYIRELKKKGVKGIFIDMIQLIQPMTGDKSKGKTEQVTNVSKQLKAIAKRNDVWIVNIAAMNRDAEKANRPPKISDIRESGQIESDSDVVMMLYRPNYDPSQPPQENSEEQIELIIGKNREGGTGTVQLLARWHICQFFELEQNRPNFNSPNAPF
jgi:replicative DNA helicase